MSRKDWLLVGLLAFFVAIVPVFLQGSYLFGFAIIVGAFGIAAMAVDLVFGYTGQISLGHGSFMAIGAYTSAILTLRYAVPPLLALVLGALLSGLIALAIGYPVLGLLTHFHLAMATLAFALLVYTFLVVGGEFTGGFSGIPGVPPFSIGPLVFKDDLSYYYWVWFVVLVLLVIALNIGKSQVGRVLKAIQDDETAARAMGIAVAKYKVKILVVSAMYTSIAGSLFAHYISAISPPQFDMILSLDLLAMDVLGGKATLVGPILGAAFLKFLPQVTEAFKDYRLFSNGIIVTMVLLFAQEGIIGLLRLFVFSNLARLTGSLANRIAGNRGVKVRQVADSSGRGE